MINKIFLGSALIASLSFSTLTFAESHQNGMNEQQLNNQAMPTNIQNDMKPGCGCPKQKLKAELNLTDAQKAKIKQIKEQARANMQKSYQDMQDIHKRMLALIQSDKVDTAELDKLVEQKTALLATKIKNKVMIKNQIFNILTPEQKTKYVESLEARAQKYHDKLRSNNQKYTNDQNDNDSDDLDNDMD